ncbi:MAG: hypothetical protein LBR88_06660 [Zoogloeaceae bacterium]|nr:hypothetical protein [Zoogloeaceae bacterium]
MKILRSLFALCCVLAAFSGMARAECPRIVSQSPYLTQALLWLGRGDCLVGVSRYDHEWPDLPRTGGVLDPDAEAIARLRPDLWIVSNWAEAATLDAATPAGATRVEVDGFRSLADAEALLVTLAEKSAAGAGATEKIAAFGRDWRAAAARIAPLAQKQRVLVVSTCMEMPFSFGRGHVIGDVFVQSGFDLVETAPKLRHLVAGAEIPDLDTLLAQTRPDLVFALTTESAEYCRMAAPHSAARVIPLDGSAFVHPGAGLLRAFTEIETALTQAKP